MKPKQDTGKFRKNTNDQFYTNAKVAKECIQDIIDIIISPKEYLWIEPSAGAGAFFNNVPTGCEKIGIDIEPADEKVIKHDFLTYTIPPKPAMKKLVFGNPPFGKQSCLAKAFIRKSAEYADIIAFILPKSFTKPSMNNSFPLNFHCIMSKELSKNAFVINGEEYDVPCVFQIWQKKDSNRVVEEKIEAVGFEYVKGGAAYDIAIRRVGVNAGKCFITGEKNCSIQSHYFILLDEKKYIDDLVSLMNEHEFPSNTVGPRSLSKSEVSSVINLILQELSSSSDEE